MYKNQTVVGLVIHCTLVYYVTLYDSPHLLPLYNKSHSFGAETPNTGIASLKCERVNQSSNFVEFGMFLEVITFVYDRMHSSTRNLYPFPRFKVTVVVRKRKSANTLYDTCCQ